MESKTNEIKGLQRCINDLVSVLALPAIWTGHETSLVATTLLDVLVQMLQLDFAFVRAIDSADELPKEWIRSSGASHRETQPHEIGVALESHLTANSRWDSLRIASPFADGTTSITALHLGIEDRVGLLIAGSRRPEFPTETERLLLQVAVNQAAIALQEARYVSQRRRTTEKLEQLVADRTAELTAANEDLLQEVVERTRAEDEVRQSGAQFQLAIDTIPGLVWGALPDGHIDYLNLRWRQFTGLTLREAGGWGWQVAIHPDDVTGLVENWRALLAFGKPGETEARLRRFDGEYRWFLHRAAPLYDGAGKLVKWYGQTTDIENLKRAEALLSTEKCTFELIAEGASLEVILEYLCNCFDGHSPDVISAFFLMEPDADHLRLVAGPRVPRDWAQVIAQMGIGPCAGSCGTAAFLKKRVVAADITIDALWVDFREVALHNGLHAAWSQPIVSMHGEVLGTFCIYHPEPRAPSDSDIQLIERAAHVALIAIERERSKMVLKRAENRHEGDQRQIRRIIDAIPQYITVLGREGNVLYANEAVLEYTGLTDEQFGAREFNLRILHPEDLERVQNGVRKGFECGVPFELQHRALRKDGSYRWFTHRYKPLCDENDQILRWYVTGVDIDDHKRAEERMQNENLALREEIDRNSMFEEIVGSSESLRKVLIQVDKVAHSDSTVLILGETGTGKELIARAIHRRSYRSAQAFIRVNCAAIPSSLIASELFGHEKGAFTGALQRRLGRFESAAGGTIFLDEVGDIPMETQIALLRVLQEREFERVGSNKPISVDVRVLAATNRDLLVAVAAGAFRQDLFYRLNVFPIQIPSLRERADDIPLLVEYLIERYAKKAGKKIRRIEKKTLNLFQAYRWPGNIRELQNVVERAVILCEGETFSVDETWLAQEPPHVPSAPGIALRGLRLDQDQERELIETALAESGGRISGATGAASKLGIPRQTLESKISNLGIDKHRFRSL